MCIQIRVFVFIGVHVFVICVYTGMHAEKYAYVCAHIGVCVCQVCVHSYGYGCVFVCNVSLDRCEYGCV